MPTDAVAYRDTLDRRGAFPFIMRDAVLGHEIAGTVVEVGEPSVRPSTGHGGKPFTVRGDIDYALDLILLAIG